MRTIKLTIGEEATAKDYACEVAEVVIADEAGDQQTYNVLCPDTSYVTTAPNSATISIRGLQEWESGLASFLWENVGSEAAFVYAPYGNDAASASQPHFTGTMLISYRPQVGGEVGSYAEVDVEYPIIGTVTMVTTAPAP
jgi:hypothetical protein